MIHNQEMNDGETLGKHGTDYEKIAGLTHAKRAIDQEKQICLNNGEHELNNAGIREFNLQEKWWFYELGNRLTYEANGVSTSVRPTLTHAE